MSPYQALNGREPLSLVCYEISPRDKPPLEEMLQGRDKLLDQLKVNMVKSQ